jgi:hypothetical protein
MGRSLPFVGVNTTIRVFRQGLSLDEVRAWWLAHFQNANLMPPIS